jgi:hypothetical protein
MKIGQLAALAERDSLQVNLPVALAAVEPDASPSSTGAR